MTNHPTPTPEDPALAMSLRMPDRQGGTVPVAAILGEAGPGVLITVPDIDSGDGSRFTFDVIAAGFDQDGGGLTAALLVADTLELVAQGIRQAAARQAGGA